jgi:hypothetical protein
MLREPESRQLATSERWQATLGRYATVDLAAIADTAFSDRTDTKFLLSEEAVRTALEALAGEYRVLDVDGTRFTPYRTQYFDTESLALFRRHHAGGSNRYKVRTRTYLNTGLSFIEIKRKTGRGATRKVRQATPEFEIELRKSSRQFIDEHSSHPAASFGPALLTAFDRICLVRTDRPERLTIDLDMAIETSEGQFRLPHVAVAELKQARGEHRHNSSFLEAMRRARIRPTGFSKYCIGLLLTRPEIKHNLFKPQLKSLRSLMGEPNIV